MELDLKDVAALTMACQRDLGNPDGWFVTAGYPKSLALCIIDSIYSTGARYTSVTNVIDRYRAYRAEQGGDANTDGVDELLTTVDQLGGADAWATRIGNRRPTSTAQNAPLKSVAIVNIASKLADLDVQTTDQLRACVHTEALKVIEHAWRTAPGQRSGITWEYALMLAQVPGVKADRMVIAYTARAIGIVPQRLASAQAAALVSRVANEQDWDVIRLDHAIWRFESGREFNQELPTA